MIWERLKHHVPNRLNWEAVGLNERLRFLKYEPGDYFAPHCDGKFVVLEEHNRAKRIEAPALSEGGAKPPVPMWSNRSRADAVKENSSALPANGPPTEGLYQRQCPAEECGPRKGDTSFMTVMLYLNGGFQGGETNFIITERFLEEEAVQVQPRAGLALVFEHRLLHEGARLTRGVKYAIRTDVMFRKVGPSTAATAARDISKEAQVDTKELGLGKVSITDSGCNLRRQASIMDFSCGLPGCNLQRQPPHNYCSREHALEADALSGRSANVGNSTPAPCMPRSVRRAPKCELFNPLLGADEDVIEIPPHRVRLINEDAVRVGKALPASPQASSNCFAFGASSSHATDRQAIKSHIKCTLGGLELELDPEVVETFANAYRHSVHKQGRVSTERLLDALPAPYRETMRRLCQDAAYDCDFAMSNSPAELPPEWMSNVCFSTCVENTLRKCHGPTSIEQLLKLLCCTATHLSQCVSDAQLA